MAEVVRCPRCDQCPPTYTRQNKAFVLQDIKSVSFEDRNVSPLTDDHEVRIHVQQTGICGSDVHFWQRGRIGDFIVDGPMVLGHESAGVVVETGARVKNVKVGDRVAIEPGVPCRRCDHCRCGNYCLCADIVFAACPPCDGTLQKYYNVASDYVYPIPDHMTSEEGALVEPVSVAVQICKVADLRAGQTVLVFGCGPIGVLSQAVAKASGATRVIGVDISESRAQFAKEFGADGIFLNKEKPGEGVDPVDFSRAVAEKIKAEHGLGEGADVVLECTGAEPCIQTGIFAAKKGGTYVQAGMGRENVVFPITTACVRALTIKGSIRYSYGCYPQAVQLIASGKVQPSKLITHRFKFDQAEEAFELVRRAEENTLKVIIEGVQS